MASLSKPRLSILVVDDEPIVSKSIQMLLQSDGHSVATADNGQDALPLLDLQHFDLILLDFTMPGMNGDELASAIRGRFAHLPIVMVTAYADNLTLSGNWLKGVDVLMNKPFTRDELREAVAKALLKY